MIGSPRSGNGPDEPARRTWPACELHGIRSAAGTGHRMRRRSGWSWTGLTPEPSPPRALPGPLLGPRPRRRRPGGPSSASVRDYRARRAAQQAKTLARDRLRAVAVDGKTSRGARRADGTRVHLLGVAEHGGRLLDHLQVDVKHNQTSHFTPLLHPLDLDGAVGTLDALPTG